MLDVDTRRALAALIERKFNPGQLRVPGGEHGGEWAKVFDKLGLGRKKRNPIQLADGEELVGSDVFKTFDGAEFLLAATRRADGTRTVRMATGVEDKADWGANNRGGTAVLDERGVGRLRNELARMGEAEKEFKDRYKAAEARYEKAAAAERGAAHRQYPHLSEDELDDLDFLETEEIPQLDARVVSLVNQQADADAELSPASARRAAELATRVDTLEREQVDAPPGRHREIEAEIVALNAEYAGLHIEREKPGGGRVGYDFLTRRRLDELHRKRLEQLDAVDRLATYTADLTPLSPADEAALDDARRELAAAERVLSEDLSEVDLVDGSVNGQWTDIEFKTDTDEQGDVRHHIDVRPTDAPDDWYPGYDGADSLTSVDLRKLSAKLAEMITVDNVEPGAARAFDPAKHPHDPATGHWSKVLAAWGDIEKLYGELHEDHAFGDGFDVNVHANGGMTMTHRPDGDADGFEVLRQFDDSDDARELARLLGDMNDAAGRYEHEGTEDLGDNGLADWGVTGSGVLVGHDRNGDISVRLLEDPDGYAGGPLDDEEGFDLSPEDAGEMADALNTMADSADDLLDELDQEDVPEDDGGGSVRSTASRMLPYDPPHAPAGSPTGGQFTTGGGGGSKGKPQPRGRQSKTRPRKRAQPGSVLAYDPKTNQGTGYGSKNGDERVHTLQQSLNKFGITDGDDKELRDDGKLGPKTTAAVKKLQKALGLTPNGKVTPAMLQLLKTADSMAALKKAVAAAKGAKKPMPARTYRSLSRSGPLLFDRTFVLDDIQISRSGDGRTVEAYAAMFGSPYEVRDEHGHYYEVIDRSAFNRTLNGAGKNAMCLYNHGMTVHGTPSELGSVPLGTPLEIKPDGKGLLTVTRYNKGPFADQVLESIRNGDIKAQSFRGRIVRSDPTGRIPRPGYGRPLPTVTRHELGLTDYGPTPVPVNDQAEIVAVRSVLDLIDDFASLSPDERDELLRHLDVPTLDGGPGIEDLEDLDEEPDGEPAGDVTATSDHSEPGTEEPPAERSDAGHSGRFVEFRRHIKTAMVTRGM